MSLVEILRVFKWIQSIAMNMSSYSAKTGDLQLSDWKMSSTTFFAGLSGLFSGVLLSRLKPTPHNTQLNSGFPQTFEGLQFHLCQYMSYERKPSIILVD